MSQAHAPGNNGQVLHITQRCHQRQFLLSGEAERRRWVYWLRQLRKTHNISVLNYIVTCNHVHLLIKDPGKRSLEAAMLLLNSRTAKEFNKRYQRKEAFWESDYKVTVIQVNAHLARCVNYIDMHMVRAGEVAHPSLWSSSGYCETKSPPRRGGALDHAGLLNLLQFESSDAMQKARDQWIVEKLTEKAPRRESYWSDSIAVGDLAFALKMKRALAFAHPASRAQKEFGCFAVR